MIIRKIENDIELSEFVTKFNKQADLRIPFQYFRLSEVYGLFDKDLMVGGYALNFSTPRWESFIPDEFKSTREYKRVAAMEKVEVNGLWLEKDYRKGKASYMVWKACILEVLKSQKLFTLGYPTSKKSLGKIYDKAGFETLYHGPSVANMEVKIVYMYPINILKIPFKSGMDLIKRRMSFPQAKRA